MEKTLGVNARQTLGKDKLLEAIGQWKDNYGGNILRQMARMGSSADPAKEYYTLSEQLSQGVKRAFVRLHEEGLVYRSTRMVNWSVRAGTALSEIEVMTEEVEKATKIEG